MTILSTLHEFLLAWLTNEDGFRDDNPDLKEAMSENGYGDVGPEELQEALPLVAEDMPLSYQRSVYEYLNAESNVDSGSTFNVDQGNTQNNAAQGTAAVAATAEPMETYPGEDPLDATVRHIYNIQNNYNTSYIDDSGDVTNTVTALGDVDFDANTATGDGAFAADDASGIVMGDNSGINAGDDVTDAQVSNVDGDGNVVGNTLGEDSNLVTGDVGGNFVDGDVSESALVGGDNSGQVVGDGANANIIGGDSGVAAAGYSTIGDIDDVNVDGTQTNVDADDSAVNIGDGEANQVDVSSSGYGEGASSNLTQVSVGSGDSSNAIEDVTTVEDNSYNVEDSYNTDIDDSYNQVDIDQDAYVGDGDGDDYGDTRVDQDADVAIGDDDGDADADDYGDLVDAS